MKEAPMSAHNEELLAAAETSNIEAVKAALEAGADVDARGPGGRTALMSASARSFIQIMEVLLGAGASVDLQGALGETALILAASGRGGESIQLLLDNGADPNLGDRDKKRPLMWMVDTQFHRGSDTSANVAPLVRAGARIDDRDDADRTALMWAVTGLGTSFDVRPSVIAALVENGADVGATDVNGETAMFHLVRYVDDALALDQGAACIRVLLEAGANPNAENNEKKTPLAVVDPRNHLVLDLLRDLGFTA
ncbi:ankyrin repeat domain-containing protein [Actinoplanes sp. NPDC051513]|uniref:ankyrin repeat domain-containing protein n=1 Tax=Actinoplanes sp. NPDC051513 TaxID=3363908 RepID=UPI0037B501F2